MFDEASSALAIPGNSRLSGVREEQELSCWFDVSGLARQSIGIAARNIAAYASAGKNCRNACVDQRLASFWFLWSLRPRGWQLPEPWDPIAGDYQTRDGWIRLHTNHHKQPVLDVLGCSPQRESVATGASDWHSDSLEAAIVQAGGCAALMRSRAEWTAHAQGLALQNEPLARWSSVAEVAPIKREIDSARPLRDIKILDLTRVLAGPVGTRFLAAYGAQVLRIDPPWWQEPGVIPEVVIGKRCAGLDLNIKHDRRIFERLLSEADVLVHGYRPGALAKLGYNQAARLAINPAIVDVSLNAYGWDGPWSGRRGFDSLVQMSCGISEQIMRLDGLEQPGSLPAAALDHASGYFIAAAVVKALHERRNSGQILACKLSLARTAELLYASLRQRKVINATLVPESEQDLSPEIEQTAWGEARRLRFPARVDGIDACFDHPAGNIRRNKPRWRQTKADPHSAR